MKVKKELKDILMNLVAQAVVTGNPETEQFKNSIRQYEMVKQFVKSLEVEE